MEYRALAITQIHSGIKGTDSSLAKDLMKAYIQSDLPLMSVQASLSTRHVHWPRMPE